MISSLPPDWMNWTVGTLIFLSAIILMLIALTIWDMKDPGWAREGWILPIQTTRGDRVFMSLLITGFIFCLWLYFFGATAIWGVLVLGVGAGVTVLNFF